MARAQIIAADVSKVALDKFRRAAKRVFPLEAFAYFIGWKGERGLYVVTDVYVPDDLPDYCTETCVEIPDHWDIEARVYAEDEKSQVVGDIHSHPYSFAIWAGGTGGDCAPSETDARYGWRGLTGIMGVIEQADKSLITRTKFYGPLAAIAAKVA